jgi:hypothetical protein
MKNKHTKGKLVETTISFNKDGSEELDNTDTYDYDYEGRLIEHCSHSVLEGKLTMSRKLIFNYDEDMETIDFYDPVRNVLYEKWFKKYFIKNCNGEDLRLQEKREIHAIPEPSYPKIEPIMAVAPFLLDMPKKDYKHPLVLRELCEFTYNNDGKNIELLVKSKNEFYPNNDDNEYTYNKHLYELDSNGSVTKQRSYFSRTGYDNMTKRKHRIMEYDDKGNMVKRLIYDNKDELESVIEKDYEYNDNELIVKQFDYTSAGILDKTIVYIYDDKKRIINEIHTNNKSGSGFKYMYSYEKIKI